MKTNHPKKRQIEAKLETQMRVREPSTLAFLIACQLIRCDDIIEEGKARFRTALLIDRALSAHNTEHALLQRVAAEAAEKVQCGCTLRERDSGHRIDCDFGVLSDALTALNQHRKEKP